MYTVNPNQLRIVTEEDYKFVIILDKNNQWIRMAHMMNWDLIDDVYRDKITVDKGRPPYSSRFAFACGFIRAYKNLSMEETLEELHENPYIAYFAGANRFNDIPDINKSTFEEFVLRFSVDGLSLINDNLCIPEVVTAIRNVDRNEQQSNMGNTNRDPLSSPKGENASPQNISSSGQRGQSSTQPHEAGSARGNSQPEGTAVPCVDAAQGAAAAQQKPNQGGSNQKRNSGSDTVLGVDRSAHHGRMIMTTSVSNKGLLIVDATVAPQDIKYPMDLDLLNRSREHLETAITILWAVVPHDGKMLPYVQKVARKSYLNVSKSKKCSKQKMRTAIGEQLRYVNLALERYAFLRALAGDIKMPKYLEDRLAVIPKVYAQQKEMYDNKTHTCADRIVSLSQPFVRPIYRGKKPLATEFGQKLHLSVVDGFTFLEQTCWSNFNESLDLIDTIEAYKARYGYYPEAVLADEIYRTKKNRDYCKERGIRLSGKPLGRPKKNIEETIKDKQIAYEDSCKRNAIEGRNGNLKRRYSLDRIMCKLDETAKSEACMDLIAMNARHRLKLEDEQRKALEELKWA